MGLERYINAALETPDKFVDPIISTQLGVQDQVVRASTVAASITITLPAVAEAAGKWYSIIFRSKTAAYTVTVADKDDSEDWAGDITLANAKDAVLAFSDGLTWYCFWRVGNSPS